MTKHEAVEILEEVRTLDDSMFAYSQAYNDALDMAIDALKAQEPETSDALKPDDNVGCWYDITHNYTLEQVVSALKSREPVAPYRDSFLNWRCGYCKTEIDRYAGDKYCPNCGRR